jgi:TonB-dependent SusC/RagA subfamily outer membrane receptor
MKWNKIILLILVVTLSQFVSGQKADKKSDKLITITGKVLNQDKNPLAGAVLYIDNVETRNVTRSNGSYKIKVSSSTINLEVRSPGYDPKKIAINGQTIINFTLTATEEQASKAGSDIKNIAAVDTIKKQGRARAKKMNTYNDIYQMIRAEVVGVVVNGKSVQIEQGHSFFGSTTPLFVINGVIVPSIDDVDPLEVKSIKILKGTSASIYGVNGTNGVISITLKNGTEKE